jgi:SpoVK/Ycf46/Vps4 family AAA+-type ATPase
VVDKTEKLETDFMHLARIALTGREQDIQLLLHKSIKRYKSTNPLFADSLAALLREAPTRASPLRRQAETPLPVDTDSRLQLLRVEPQPVLDHTPVLSAQVSLKLRQLIDERLHPDALLKAGLQPTKTALFTGLPGVGKTLAARWVSVMLRRPLLTLDLAAVMSSYLGRTGSNLRYVLDYAKSTESVLLLDELDAIAKRRDDNSEIGELKRLVTVLIQEIDDWPSSGLLLAATNHPELLDPAIWRRFDAVVEFPLPDQPTLQIFIKMLLDQRIDKSDAWAAALSIGLLGKSFSDVEHDILSVRRASVLGGIPIETALESLLVGADMSKSDRIALAAALVENDVVSQRRAHELTGVARETIRSRAKSAKGQSEDAAQ